MKFGLMGINYGVCANLDLMTEVVIAAEQAGFDSVWTGEHLVLPDPQTPDSPTAPTFPYFDSLSALSYLSGVTNKIKLCTGVVLIALRNPVLLAKETATIDHLSRGRLLFGIGSGYLAREFEVLNKSFADRGARTDEYIDVLRELWVSEQPRFDGPTHSFDGIQSRPLAYQKGGPPIIVGGWSEPALRRAAKKAQGWYGYGMDVLQTKACIDAMDQASETEVRPEELGELEISMAIEAHPTEDLVEKYEDIGVTRLILTSPFQGQWKDRGAIMERIDITARLIG